MTTSNAPTHKSICKSCGKEGFCLYEDKEQMAYCPTFIRKRLDRTKTLASSPFKCLSRFHISPRI